MVVLLAIVLLMPVVASADTLDEDALRQLLAPAEAAHARRMRARRCRAVSRYRPNPGPAVAEPPPQAAEASGSPDAPAASHRVG